MNLGIVGAENSHAGAIGKLLNIDKKIRGLKATHIWGETKAFAQSAAAKSDIPTIVDNPEEMIGQVDCVMIDHRDGVFHVPAAIPFVQAGLPVFVDKPLSTRLRDAKKLMKLRRERGVPVTSMSAVPWQASTDTLIRDMKKLAPLGALQLVGAGDYKSKYGGIGFYGIHLVETMIRIVGAQARWVRAETNGPNCSVLVGYGSSHDGGEVDYNDGLVVTLSFTKEKVPFAAAAGGPNGWVSGELTFDDNPYLAPTKIWSKMFRTGTEPIPERDMLAAVAVLEAMVKSVAEKRPVRVGRVRMT